MPIEEDSVLFASMVNNLTLQQDYIEHYYDDLQVYHIVIISIDVLIFLLAFLNIAPAQEDIRFGFHLLVSLLHIAYFKTRLIACRLKL